MRARLGTTWYSPNPLPRRLQNIGSYKEALKLFYKREPTLFERVNVDGRALFFLFSENVVINEIYKMSKKRMKDKKNMNQDLGLDGAAARASVLLPPHPPVRPQPGLPLSPIPPTNP